MFGTINKWVANPSNLWIVITIFALVLSVSVFVGVWRGWKKALYFTSWNIISLVLSILLASVTSNWLIKSFSSPVETILGTFTPYFVPIVALVYLILINIIGWIPYLIFVKPWIKRLEIKDTARNRGAGYKWMNGTLGATIGVVGALPMCVLATNVGAVTTGNVSLAAINDQMISVVTASKYKGISVPIVKIKKLALFVYLGVHKIQDIANFLFGMSISDLAAIVDNHDLVNNLLNWTEGHKILGDLIKSTGATLNTTSEEVLAGMSSFVRPEEVQAFIMSDAAKESFKHSIFALIGDSSENAEQIITAFINELCK